MISPTWVQKIFCIRNSKKDSGFSRFVKYTAGNQHIPHQGIFEDDFPLPRVGYVSSLEGIDLPMPLKKHIFMYALHVGFSQGKTFGTRGV